MGRSKELQVMLQKLINAIFLTRDEGESESGPSWRFRRMLIFGSYRLGFGMIVLGAFSLFSDMYGVGAGLIAGGVSLISIILTAYTATATFEDVKLWKPSDTDESV